MKKLGTEDLQQDEEKNQPKSERSHERVKGDLALGELRHGLVEIVFGVDALKVNDGIDVKDSNVARQMATKNLEASTSRAVPDWLTLDKEAMKGTVARIPSRDEIQPIANEQAVVEFYSR